LLFFLFVFLFVYLWDRVGGVGFLLFYATLQNSVSLTHIKKEKTTPPQFQEIMISVNNTFL